MYVCVGAGISVFCALVKTELLYTTECKNTLYLGAGETQVVKSKHLLLIQETGVQFPVLARGGPAPICNSSSRG